MRKAFLLFSLSLLVACGGKVVVDADTQIPGQPSCQEACEKSIAACPLNPGEDCSVSCSQAEQVFGDVCPEAWNAWLQCTIEHPDANCSELPTCASETDALGACFSMACPDPSSCL